MSTSNSGGDSLFNIFADLASESVRDIGHAIGDGVKEIANLANSPAQPISDAQYFANACDNPKDFPPRDEAMTEQIEDRQSAERIEDNLRVADGGSPELSEQEKQARMQDRMQSYLASQMQLSL